jgi:hypothetical protein
MSESKIKEAHEVLKRHLVDDATRLTFYGTVLACGMNLVDFIIASLPSIEHAKGLPRHTQYMIALLLQNYRLALRPDLIDKGSAFSVDFQKYFESGNLDERFVMVVKQLYEYCKDEHLL